MTDRPRFSISLDDATFDRLERYRYENRLSTRSKAASILISNALDLIEKGELTPDELTADERSILEGFNAASDERRGDMLHMAKEAIKRKKRQRSLDSETTYNIA